MLSGSNRNYCACPHCGSTEVHVTRWTGFVERCVLHLWGMCPYRCITCYRRFYWRTFVTQEAAKKTT